MFFDPIVLILCQIKLTLLFLLFSDLIRHSSGGGPVPIILEHPMNITVPEDEPVTLRYACIVKTVTQTLIMMGDVVRNFLFKMFKSVENEDE